MFHFLMIIFNSSVIPSFFLASQYSLRDIASYCILNNKNYSILDISKWKFQMKTRILIFSQMQYFTSTKLAYIEVKFIMVKQRFLSNFSFQFDSSPFNNTYIWICVCTIYMYNVHQAEDILFVICFFKIKNSIILGKKNLLIVIILKFIVDWDLLDY